MNKQEAISKFLTEKFLGGCWHEWNAHTRPTSTTFTCVKCKADEFVYTGEDGFAREPVQDLFTWSGLGILWEKAQKEEWWDKFLRTTMPSICQCSRDNLKFINPQTFPILLAEFLTEFLGWKEGE